jgi:Big-like domain-containing protein
VVLALLAGACDGGTPVENTPAATPTPPAVTLPAGPMPVEAAEVAPTPPPGPGPRNPNPGPGGPPPSGTACGTPEVTITQPSSGQNLTSGSQQINAVVGSTVARVDFYYHIDSAGLRDPAVFIGQRNGPPWRVNWGLPNICNSSVRIFGIGWDGCGNVADSNWVTVRVCR